LIPRTTNKKEMVVDQISNIRNESMNMTAEIKKRVREGYYGLL
jgi:RNA binding exosome subunit